MAAGQALDQRFEGKFQTPPRPLAPISSAPNDEQPYYNLTDTVTRNLSYTPYPISAWVEFTSRRRSQNRTGGADRAQRDRPRLG